jgi:hypothetical protein
VLLASGPREASGGRASLDRRVLGTSVSMATSGRSGPVNRAEIREAMLSVLRAQRGELFDINELSTATLQARSVVPGSLTGTVGDIVSVVNELVNEGIVEEIPVQGGAARYRLAG